MTEIIPDTSEVKSIGLENPTSVISAVHNMICCSDVVNGIEAFPEARVWEVKGISLNPFTRAALNKESYLFLR